MPIFDPTEQRLCVRVVYDGVGGAGKTTNLRMLCELFATQRTASLYSPGEIDGRTVYFDWVQILAGSVCGFPLTCQVISVPGQLVLTPRRRELLASADVVVLVCDSSPAGADAGRKALGVLDEVGHDGSALLVQANKQDQTEALPGAELLARLGREGVPVVEAIATEGIGVIDTFVSAVRLVSRAMQADAEQGRLRLEVKRAQSASDVLARLRRQAIDPEWAAEMVLEEAQTALLLSSGVADEALVSRSPRETSVASPQLPTEDVPAGFIWPAHTGRAILRTLRERAGLDRAIAVGADGRVEHVAFDHVFRTRKELRFVDREEARQALVSAARERTQLGTLLVPDTVLVAQPASDGAWWIWETAPRLPTVLDALSARPEDPSTLCEAYGVAVVDALSASMRHRFSVELGPASFGFSGGVVRYAGPARGGALEQDALSAQLEAAALSVEVAGGLDAFLAGFARTAQRQLEPEEIARISSLASTVTTSPRIGPSASAWARLSALLARVAAA